MTLREFFAGTPRVAVAFSGGVDSAYVLWAAKTYGQEVRPYYVHTPFQPAWELQDARQLAQELNTPLTVVEVDILAHKSVADNPPNRCYHCKTALFSALWERVKGDGFSVLVDGTNADDDPGERPGMAALDELSVCSPLRVCGMTKAQVREESQRAGLFTWNKPAYACLATRIPTGTPITAQWLERVEEGEERLQALGFVDFRLRLTPQGGGQLQVTGEQMALAMAKREAIVEALSPLVSPVLLDLTPRTATCPKEGTP